LDVCSWIAGDTKAGTLIGKDKFGNKYFENLEEELPCMNVFSPLIPYFHTDEITVRTRWIDYKEYEFDPYVPLLFLRPRRDSDIKVELLGHKSSPDGTPGSHT